MEFLEVEKVLKDYGKYVVQQSKSNLTKSGKGDGALYNSISFEIIEDNTAVIVEFWMEDYGSFVDDGVKGANPRLVDSEKTGRKGRQKAPYSKFSYKSKRPPLDMLVAWAKRKNVRFRIKKGQKGGGQFKKGSYRQMGFWLQKSIFAQGMSPTYFFSKPFAKGIEKYELEMSKAFTRDIESKMIFTEK
tara:strand:+ start:2963 stop:3526 length:564 start_codon:yes stop_codon:yes gene_type:complete